MEVFILETNCLGIVSFALTHEAPEWHVSCLVCHYFTNAIALRVLLTMTTLFLMLTKKNDK